MGQSPAEREADIKKFREVFGDVAPEFTKPLTFSTPGGDKKEIPYILTKLGKDSAYGDVRAVFEAQESGEADTVSRIDYGKTYGLNLRRSLYLHTKSNSLIQGEVTFKSGELKAILWSEYSCMFLLHPLVIEHQLSLPQDFDAGITIVNSESSKTIPPIAEVEYTRSLKIPLTAEFPCANFETAKAGTYDIRQGKYNSRPLYETTYFQWENLAGAKIGRSKFRDEGTWLTYSDQVAGINQKEWTKIKDSLYLGKMTHSRDRSEFGRGRLRFHRKDADGELWMFSVPEWLDKTDFLRHLQGATFMDFLYHYPVIFWVKQNGQDIQRISTWGRKDIPR